MTADAADQLKALDATIASIEKVLDVAALRRDLGELEEMAGAPDLWDDQERAQSLMSRMATVKSDLERVEGVRRRHDDLVVLLELAELEDDEGTRTEVEAELGTLGRDVEALEVRTLLSGEYDAREALVQISPGAGGVDSQDWAEMLLRMYTRWAEQRGYPVEVYETQYAEEAGIKSVTFAIKAPYAYGTLAGEHGVHRLVRISPFDNQARRQTSFAAVDVTPVIETTEAMEIPENEIRVDVYRSSGPGGQSVNTTDSAVRLTHIPTGVVVSCQNEKSQLQNKASAMRILTSRLLERRRQEEQAKMDSIRGSKSENAFGSQIRNYVLHPYQLVKDVRTNVETGNTGSVLDGEIDEFVEAGIRWRRALADAPAEA